ncbi:gp041L [Rabbit fibroma virus]|uniref:Gp041L n=1 Tax=Rabbit fibroma virus (strain Kasza) TaxID=10272 RepID=Q9Q930_RFVKA|nr:putative IMV membrane protein [Rabbit fibroma virus]AAF17923.1 gp041L [Rabbit fibroma virus]
MALTAKEVISFIWMTLLFVVMLLAGSALLFKTYAPHKVVMTRSAAFMRVVNYFELVAILVFIPGTVSLYWSYVKSLRF